MDNGTVVNVSGNYHHPPNRSSISAEVVLTKLEKDV